MDACNAVVSSLMWQHVLTCMYKSMYICSTSVAALQFQQLECTAVMLHVGPI